MAVTIAMTMVIILITMVIIMVVTRSYCRQDCKILAVTTGTWSDHWTFFPFFSLKNDFLEEKY